MMIERDPRFFWDVYCDHCPLGEERMEAEHFQQVIDDIKELGWVIICVGPGQFDHICPDCVEVE